MRFKLDENIPTFFKEYLLELNHDVHSVFDEKLNGFPDPDVAVACQLEKRILLTLDLDFADTRTYPPSDYHGIIVLRPKHQSIRLFLPLLKSTLDTLNTEPITGKLWIVEYQNIRVK